VDAGAMRPVISDDGRFVAYNTLSATSDTFVRDRATGRELRITSNANDPDAESFRPEISGDGSHIIFASDLQLAANDQNGERDVYLADISSWIQGGASFTTKLVSVGTNGLAVGASSSRPGINHNGSVVSFQSFAGNLVAGDTNGTSDAFVRDYRSNPNGQTYAVSYRADGTIPPNASSSRPQLDDSGDIVTFVSTGGNIVNGDTNDREDAFIRNWKAELGGAPNNQTFLLGISPGGEPGVCPGIPNVDEGTKDISTRSYLSGDGKVAVFISGQCNLTGPSAFGGPDTNLLADVFIRTFRGVTPPVPLTSNFTPLPGPARLLDTRPGTATVDGLFAGAGVQPGKTILELDVWGRAGVPVGANTATLNITVTQPVAAGFLTVFPCGQPLPTASSLNYATGQTIANTVVAKLGTSGRVCIYTFAPTHLIADVGGYLGTASQYVPGAAPARLLDTRPGSPTVDGKFSATGPMNAGQILQLPVGGRAGVPGGASSVVLNVTATNTGGAGYVTVYPCGALQPTASNLNFVPGQTIANAVVSKLGTNGRVCFFAAVPTHLIVDVGGHFPSTQVFTPLTTPVRLLDTRPGTPTVDGQFAGTGPVGANGVLQLKVAGRGGVPANATSVVLNVTVTQPAGPGYVSVYPCGQPPPNASNLNYAPGDTVPNAVVARVGVNGTVCLYTFATTHLIVDASGTLK
jgi:hypothetical protein